MSGFFIPGNFIQNINFISIIFLFSALGHPKNFWR